MCSLFHLSIYNTQKASAPVLKNNTHFYWPSIPRTRHGPQTFSQPVTFSQQIFVAVIPRPGLRMRTLKLGSLVTSSKPHSCVRQSRNKTVGHIDTLCALLNILSLAASWIISWDPLHIHCKLSPDSLCLINQYCTLVTKAFKVKKVLCLP